MIDVFILFCGRSGYVLSYLANYLTNKAFFRLSSIDLSLFLFSVDPNSLLFISTVLKSFGKTDWTVEGYYLRSVLFPSYLVAVLCWTESTGLALLIRGFYTRGCSDE